MKKLTQILCALVILVVASDAYATLIPIQVRRYQTKAELDAAASSSIVQDGAMACVLNVDACYMKHGSLWKPLDPRTPEVFATFGAGATHTPALLVAGTGVVQSASAAQQDLLYVDTGITFVIGQSTAQTVVPTMTAVGLDLAGDLVNAEAQEIYGGVLGASGRPFVCGQDPAFKFCATWVVSDADGLTDLHCGFRTATQTQVKALGTYLNFATIGIEGTASPNVIQIMTSDDDSETTTDTTNTWADAASKELCVLESSTCVTTYTINGSAPTATAAFTFDAGDSLIPFCAIEHGANAAGDTDELTEWKVAYQ